MISEGVDIRSVSSIILFSSDRRRLETIQRIGRALRTDPSDPEKRALVIDFVRVSDDQEPNGETANKNADFERSVWLKQLSEIEV